MFFFHSQFSLAFQNLFDERRRNNDAAAGAPDPKYRRIRSEDGQPKDVARVAGKVRVYTHRPLPSLVESRVRAKHLNKNQASGTGRLTKESSRDATYSAGHVGEKLLSVNTLLVVSYLRNTSSELGVLLGCRSARIPGVEGCGNFLANTFFPPLSFFSSQRMNAPSTVEKLSGELKTVAEAIRRQRLQEKEKGKGNVRVHSRRVGVICRLVGERDKVENARSYTLFDAPKIYDVASVTEYEVANLPSSRKDKQKRYL